MKLLRKKTTKTSKTKEHFFWKLKGTAQKKNENKLKAMKITRKRLLGKIMS